MIATTLEAAPGVPAAVSEARAMIERLRGCAPTREAEAVKCLDRVLSKEQKLEILGTRFRDLNWYGWLGARIEQAWFEGIEEPPPSPQPPIRRHLLVFLDEEGLWNRQPGQVTVETYWLSKHRCPLDFKGRAAQAKITRAADEAWDRSVAESEALTPPGAHATYIRNERERATAAYKPKCTVEARR